MRLRLTVGRNALPETHVIWHIETGSEPTIFQLLEAVNPVFPLENGEWGLEDYVVELKGTNDRNFECLHFQEVSKVFKEDDEVLIRPLLFKDLKLRRLSGRHQISEDGKHLVDGLAFGRPLLRPPLNRPDVHIPPRKKARLMITENAGDDDEDEDVPAFNEQEAAPANAEQQLILHPDFNDDSSEGDEDFAAEDDDDEDEGSSGSETESTEEALESDLDELLNVVAEPTLKEESTNVQPATTVEQAIVKDKNPTVNDEEMEDIYGLSDDVAIEDSDEEALADVSDENDRFKIRKLHEAFPQSSMGVCKYVLRGANGDMIVAFEALIHGFESVIPKSVIAKISQEEKEISSPENKSKSKKRPAKVLDGDEDAVSYYDQNGLPPGSITSGKALSAMAEAAKSSPLRYPLSKEPISMVSKRGIKFSLNEDIAKGLTSTPAIDQESVQEEEALESSESGSDEESEDESEDDDTSTSGSGSSSEEDSDDEGDLDSVQRSENGEAPAKVEDSDTSTSGSDSDSSSDSSSDDGVPEEVSSKSTPISHATEAEDHEMLESQAPATVPYEKGMKKTKARNARRTKFNQWKRYLNKGILPAGTTLQEFLRIHVDAKTTPDKAKEMLEAASAVAPAEPTADTSEFERKRQELLASIASSGVEVDSPSSKKSGANQSQNKHSRSASRQASQELAQSENLVSAESEQPVPALAVQEELDEVHPPTAPEAPATLQAELPADSSASVPSSQTKEASSRKSKIDLGAGRRLLFGALGIKTPKTKKDEEKIRNNLMKDVRPLRTPKPTEELVQNSAEEDENLDVWREKISYRAVECCQEGIELSEPPFPFKQRWDPQQQRGGKRKNQRDENQYHDDSYSSKNQKRRKGKHNYAQRQEYLDASYQPSYLEDSVNTQFENLTQMSGVQGIDVKYEISRQLSNDIQQTIEAVQDPDDLIALPNSPSSLPDLHEEAIRPGMIIAFKQLEMSEATNWQPQMSSYLTAIITDVSENYQIEMTLAKRDRENPDRMYDEETGERIYGKFDMPLDDEDDIEDDGRKSLSFHELIEPKVLADSSAGSQDIKTDEASQPKGGRGTDEFVTLSHEHPSHDDEPPEAQFSHVTETVLDSDTAESVEEIEADIEVPAPEAPDVIAQVPEINLQEQVEATVQEEFTDKDANIEEAVGAQISQVLDPAPEAQVETNTIDFEMTNAPTPGVESQFQTDIAIVSSEIPETVLPEQATESFSDEVIERAVSEISNVKVPSAKPVTPTKQIDTQMTNEVSEEARKTISKIISEAGFRSSVPSSVMREIGPDFTETPGDADALQKLLRDMTENDDSMYSPKFNGFGTSPIRKQRRSESPQKSQHPPSYPPSSPPPSHVVGKSKQDNFKSPAPSPTPPSSWHTIDEDSDDEWEDEDVEEAKEAAIDSEFNAQAVETQDMQIDEAPEVDNIDIAVSKSPTEHKKDILGIADEVTNDFPISSAKPQEAASEIIAEPKVQANKPEVQQQVRGKIKVSKVPKSKAKEIWENHKPKPKKPAATPVESPNMFPGFMGFDAIDETDPGINVEYPKLADNLSSTSTSQVTDHGRQPDFNLQDSGTTNADTSVPPHIGDEGAITEPEMDLPAHKAIKQTDMDEAKKEHELPSRKSSSKNFFPGREFVGFNEDDSSDEFPDPKEFYSQPLPKKEKVTLIRRSRPLKEKISMTHLEDVSEFSDTSSPKASQKQKQRSESQRSESRKPSGHSQSLKQQLQQSTPRASQPRASQPSQAIDLTNLESSDVESEPEPAAPVRKHSPQKVFKVFNIDETDDEIYNEPKKEPGVRDETKRHRNTGLKDSSQSSQNKVRRKSYVR